jgi:hypothetical protein
MEIPDTSAHLNPSDELDLVLESDLLMQEIQEVNQL